MSRVFLPGLSFALALLLSGTVHSAAQAQAPDRRAAPPDHFPDVDVLLGWQADGRLLGGLPNSEALDSLRQLLVELNVAYDETALAEHGRMQQLAHERLAAGRLRPTARVMPAGALGRYVGVLDGTSVSVDFFPGVDETLDDLHLELVTLDEIGAQLILAHFGSGARFIWTAESRAGSPEGERYASSTDSGTCPFTTRTFVDTDPPPSCVSSWGVSYSVAPGSCNPDTKCEGTVSASITQRKDDPCRSAEMFTWYYVWDDDLPALPSTHDPILSPEGLPDSGDIDLACGTEYQIHFAANDVPLGRINLTCNNCVSEND